MHSAVQWEVRSVAQTAALLMLLEELEQQVVLLVVPLMARVFVAMPIVHLQRRLASDHLRQPLFPT